MNLYNTEKMKITMITDCSISLFSVVKRMVKLFCDVSPLTYGRQINYIVVYFDLFQSSIIKSSEQNLKLLNSLFVLLLLLQNKITDFIMNLF